MSKPKFAKLFDVETGQVLITIVKYLNAAELSVQFNDAVDEDGIHRFNMLFVEKDKHEAQEMFDDLNESNIHRLIQQVLQNAEHGITEGKAKDLADLIKTVH